MFLANRFNRLCVGLTNNLISLALTDTAVHLAHSTALRGVLPTQYIPPGQTLRLEPVPTGGSRDSMKVQAFMMAIVPTNIIGA